MCVKQLGLNSKDYLFNTNATGQSSSFNNNYSVKTEPINKTVHQINCNTKQKSLIQNQTEISNYFIPNNNNYLSSPASNKKSNSVNLSNTNQTYSSSDLINNNNSKNSASLTPPSPLSANMYLF